jgi:diadenosine tetraphosphate (Ap4A) HIT family hydrolase
MNCSLCERVKEASKGDYPFLVKEYDHSYLMLGEHQFYRGYCVLISKSHHREMADIPSPERESIFQEMMATSKALQQVFQPKKMNLCSLGNVAEHLHWHFFPRYGDDPDFTNPPWLQMHQFEQAKITSEARDELVALIQSASSSTI